MPERITRKVSEARALFDSQVEKLYQARLTLSAICGGGAMSPTPREIKSANEVNSEITDENVRLAVEAKLDDAHNVNQGATGSDKWWLVKFPR